MNLPPEWRLSWYANHFRWVVTPKRSGCQLSVDQIDQWVEDTDPEFRLILEVDSEVFSQTLLDRKRLTLEAIETRFKGQPDAVIFRSIKDEPINWEGLNRVRDKLTDAAFCLTLLKVGAPRWLCPISHARCQIGKRAKSLHCRIFRGWQCFGYSHGAGTAASGARSPTGPDLS